MRTIIAVITILFLLIAPAMAKTIYVWTDKDGVRRFSDQLPEGVENYETFEGTYSAPSSNDETRPGLQKMVEEVEQKDKQTEQKKVDEAARQKASEAAAKQAAEAKAQAAAKEDPKITAERARLQRKIDALNNRAMSPGFTQGMRDNQIQEIQKQIDALNERSK